VFACVRVLSETLASLPLVFYERLDRGKRRAPDHPLYTLLHDAPNPEQTSFEFRLVLMAHLALWGNGYAQIEYDAGGEVTELWPLRPDRMLEIRRVQGRKMYHYQLANGEMQWIPGERIWHLRTLGTNGSTGLSMIQLHKQGIGLGLATEQYGGAFFGNNAVPSGLLTYPGELSEEAANRLRAGFEGAHKGLSKAHRVALLEEGLTYQQVGVPPEDAQFLETRLFQKREIASIYRVPPHLIGDLERATFSNIEHQSIEFVSYTMLPWFVNWEQSIKQNLMLGRDRARYFAEFLTAALERGDIKSRYEAYAQGRQNGWLSANDIREMENLNPVEGGDIYLVPLNMVAVGGPEADGEGRHGDLALLEEGRHGELPLLEPRQRDEALRRLEIATEYLPLFRDILARTVRREVADIRREARKLLKRDALSDFLMWLERFYESHQEFMSNALAPAYTAYSAAVVRAVQAEIEKDGAVDTANFRQEYASLYGVRYTAKQRQELVGLIERTQAEEQELLPAIEGRLDHWDEVRPDQEARRESRRAMNAIAILAYATLGVTIKRWAASGDSCPYCLQLDGEKIEVHGFFLPSGGQIEVEGQEPMRVDINLGHPPAHDGCDCMVVAG
jgi:HK97 family phage portal protein